MLIRLFIISLKKLISNIESGKIGERIRFMCALAFTKDCASRTNQR